MSEGMARCLYSAEAALMEINGITRMSFTMLPDSRSQHGIRSQEIFSKAPRASLLEWTSMRLYPRFIYSVALRVRSVHRRSSDRTSGFMNRATRFCFRSFE